MPALKDISTRRMNVFTISVPTGSSSTFLRNLTRNMGWKTTVTRQKEETPVKMTKEEYFAMLDERIAEAEEDRREGRLIAMGEDETGEEFINRLLCM